MVTTKRISFNLLSRFRAQYTQTTVSGPAVSADKFFFFFFTKFTATNRLTLD